MQYVFVEYLGPCTVGKSVCDYVSLTSLCWSHSHWAGSPLAGVRNLGEVWWCAGHGFKPLVGSAGPRPRSLPAGYQLSEEISSGSGRRGGLSCKSPLHVCLVADTNHPSRSSVLLNPEMLLCIWQEAWREHFAVVLTKVQSKLQQYTWVLQQGSLCSHA